MSISAITAVPSAMPSLRYEQNFGRFGLTVWSGDFCSFDRYRTNHSHIHDSYHELCLVLGGTGLFSHGGSRYPLTPGSLFFSEIGVPHEISSMKTRNLRLVFVHLVITTSERPLSTDLCDIVLDRFRHAHRIAVTACADLAAYLGPMCRGGDSAMDVFRRSEAARLFTLESLYRLAARPISRASAAAEIPDTVARALSFIEGNLSGRPTVGEVAEACFCSPRHLRRLFRAATGRTVLDTMNERAVRLSAQKLLMRFTVTEVAESLGFESLAHFSRLFKRYHGSSPKTFQIKHAPRPVVPSTSFGVG